jgi:hypothetical protein
MSHRISVTLSDEEYAILQRLAETEKRSESNCLAAIFSRAVPELRQEWRATGAVKSLKKKNSRRYNADIENMPLDAA